MTACSSFHGQDTKSCHFKMASCSHFDGRVLGNRAVTSFPVILRDPSLQCAALWDTCAKSCRVLGELNRIINQATNLKHTSFKRNETEGGSTLVCVKLNCIVSQLQLKKKNETGE